MEHDDSTQATAEHKTQSTEKEQRDRERKEFYAAWIAYENCLRSTKPEPPAWLKAELHENQRKSDESRKREEERCEAERKSEAASKHNAIVALQAETGLDANSARLLHKYRSGPSTYLTGDEMEYCEALEKQLAKLKAERALSGFADANKPYTIDWDKADHEREQRQGGSGQGQSYAERARGSTAPPRQFTLIPFEQIRVDSTPAFVVKGIVPRHGLVTTWGPPKCGKSFMIFDLAMHVALGWQYRNHKVQQGPVVYVAAEGGNRFADRVEAWRQRHLVEGSVDPIPFYLLAVPLDLIAEHAVLIAAIQAQAKGAPTVVVLDTLNRTLVGSENKPEDMARYIRAADAIRMAFGCAVIVIHHCGIDGSRPRGHTSLAGADDAQIAVSRDSTGLIKVEVEHFKDGIASPPFACRLENVDLGTDRDGNEMSSCVIVAAELPTTDAKARGGKVSPNQNRFLDILTDAILDAPPEHKTTSGIPAGRLAVSREYLKQCCIAKGWIDDTESVDQKRLKVNNMINLLAGKHLIGATKLFVWDAR
jgi:hypothetical protein